MNEIKPGRPEAARSGFTSKPAADLVKPQQYDLMRAPVWTPPAAAPARAGSLNHKRIESRGFRC
ncbi:hypothetical protein [Acidovorax sp.]|uniref:hypothetical protein n=1 Tax=Acidovorax sp. TaxID=1872122 RepID=UPI002ACE39FF|nr:hypothetical protein [Acidovorax sp.]MDZ7862417.1 hypothetical protein [Acidovorax sp.]